MKRFRILFLVILSGLLLGVSYGQTKHKKPMKIRYQGETFLAGQVGNGTISKKLLDSLIRMPLFSRDSLGRLQPVIGFKLTWAELALYEDSTGRPMILADYYETFSDDQLNTVPQPWLDLILKRSKPGDTLTFTHVTATMMPQRPVDSSLVATDSMLNASGGVSPMKDATGEIAADSSDTTTTYSKKSNAYFYRSEDLRLIVTE